MIKKDLQKIAGISSNAIAKMGKGGDVSTHILSKICRALNCNIDDIVELDEIANLKNNSCGYQLCRFRSSRKEVKACGVKMQPRN